MYQHSNKILIPAIRLRVLETPLIYFLDLISKRSPPIQQSDGKYRLLNRKYVQTAHSSQFRRLTPARILMQMKWDLLHRLLIVNLQ